MKAQSTLTTPRTNDQWLGSLSQNDEAREEALMALRRRLLKGLGTAMAGKGIDRTVFEDAVQEALVKILANLGSFRGQSRFETWAMTIAVREVWTELRRRHWKNVSLDEILQPHSSGPKQPLKAEEEIGRGAEQSQLLRSLRNAIDSDLTEKQRIALTAELEGMPQEEIARRMGSNRNALYKLVHDARKRLRASLETAGFSTADIISAFE
ncbi:MAG: sigma-70 family RNA polymerase sigma factor [Deltaproteobacteria bacterium]|nr:sigma-70 family RNA polymerase sigma factor [Deltaproteobacteria bacterium]